MFLYCLVMIYKYYSRLGFIPTKHNEEGRYIHNKILNNISHSIKHFPRVNCLQCSFVTFNDKLIIRKLEVIPPIPDSMILVDFLEGRTTIQTIV